MRFLTILCALFIGSSARAEDWPQWMGPQRDNVWREKDILTKFPKDGPKVLWSKEIANGFSGPAVAGGLVYLTDFVTKADLTADNFDREKYVGKERVACFDSRTGEVKWRYEYDCTYTMAYPNGPRCTPVVDSGKVYTLGGEGNLYCFDAKTGRIEWSSDLKTRYKVEAPLWGFAAHPLIDGNRLICLVGGKGSVVVAFDKNTGKELWKNLSSKEPGYSPPTIANVNGDRQLIIWHPESINGLEPETGKEIWSVKQTTVNGTSIMAPRVFDNKLFVGAWQRKGVLLDLKTMPTPKALWKGDRDSSVYPINGTPQVDGNYLYGVCTDGELRCIDLKDGDRKWETYKPVAGDKAQSGTAHLIKHEDRYFIFAETGHLISARLSAKGYDEISRWQIVRPTSKAFGRDVVWAHPAFAQQCVFARNDRELVCISLAK